MKVFSTFSGIGGFEIGIQSAWRTHVQTLRGGKEDTEGVDEKWQRLHTFSAETAVPTIRRDNEHIDARIDEGQPHCIGYSEIDKYAIKVYEYQFGGECENCRLARERERNSGTYGRQETLDSERTRLSQAVRDNDDTKNERSESDRTTCEHAPKNYGDITKINAEELPDFDCLVGGFPCQAFSIAGKRKGFEDTRGTLFFDLARILRAKQPRLFVFENVKGLLSHDSGRTFKTIIQTIDELGYDCQWQVLNSKNHGVPQNRERIYIVGHLRGTPRPEVFPIESDHGETSNEVTHKGQLVDLTRREPTSYRERTDGRAGTLDANYYKGLANQERPGVVQPFTVSKIDRKNKEYTLKDTEVSGTLTATMWKGIDALNRTGVKQLNNPTHSNDRVYASDGISPTLNTMQGGNRQPFVKVPEATKKGYAEATVGQAINLSVPNSKTRRGRVSDIAPTLDTGMQIHTLVDDTYGTGLREYKDTAPTLRSNRYGLKVSDEIHIRRLTPIECERLQGFPDNWTAEGTDGSISDTQRYKMCGNAVTTNVVQAVFERIFTNG